MRKRCDTVIFDLDGTLLDTLEDLGDSVNFALERMSMPVRSLEEVRRFVGNGVARLMELAVPGGRENTGFEEALTLFREHYSANCNVKTRVYPHILEMLEELRREGYALAVVSNKYDAAVQELKNRYFGELLGVAVGEKEGIRRKPAPDMVFEALRQLGRTADTAVYVGDSEVDVAVAGNAGIPCVCVPWGFRSRREQEAAGGKIFVREALELPEVLRRDERPVSV